MPDNENELSRYEVQTRLIRMIISMSDPEKKKLLKKVEESVLLEMRKHPRDPSFIPVECSSSDGVCFTDFIQDISDGGFFIQTDGHFFVSQQITLTFSLPKAGKDISVSGEVVRIDSRGIGVKFNELLTTR